MGTGSSSCPLNTDTIKTGFDKPAVVYFISLQRGEDEMAVLHPVLDLVSYLHTTFSREPLQSFGPHRFREVVHLFKNLFVNRLVFNIIIRLSFSLIIFNNI